MRLFLLAFLLVPALMIASACSSDSSKDSTVKVALSEFALTADPDSVPAGKVTFEVKNNGQETHDLVVLRTAFAPGDLPTKSDGTVDQGADGIDVVGSTNEIDGGDTDTRVFSLTADKYVLISNVARDKDGQKEADYKNGMRLAFNVTAAP